MKPSLEEMAEALLARDALRLRQASQDWLRALDESSAWSEPRSDDESIRIAAAALAELFAGRLNRPAPEWARSAGEFATPFYALRTADRLRSVREECDREAPRALRRHGILAPANFLEFA